MPLRYLLASFVSAISLGGMALGSSGFTGEHHPIGNPSFSTPLSDTARGYVPIEEIRAGDYVVARDERTGRQALRPVVDTFETLPTELFHLGFDTDGDGFADEEISSTGEHPFFVLNDKPSEGGEFRAVKDLRVGNLISDFRRTSAQVVSIRHERAPPESGTFTTYNFEVEDFHTYFVGESGVWVHNSGAPCQKFFAIMERMRTRLIKSGKIVGDGTPSDEWRLLQATLVFIREEKGIVMSDKLFGSIIKRFGDENFGGGLVDIPSVPFNQASLLPKYNKVQDHHWWPKEWLTSAMKTGDNYTKGLTIPLATPIFHTRLPHGLQPLLNRFMREHFGGVDLPSAKGHFHNLPFDEQKNLMRAFYESQGLKMPDFTSPGLQ